MYYQYWELEKPPFDNVPDPSMYVECHPSLENAMAETLFAIEEGNECMTVIVGEVGLGKTLSLRMIIDALNAERYKVALITNPDMSFAQILREIIGQLTGRQCEKRKKADLLENFNELLFKNMDGGKKVLLFIDEANAISSFNLENLRLLTNMQDDSRNLFTIVLAGQMELARRLEHPKRANLFQRIGTYCRLDKLQSEDMVRTYVETRLRLAGCKRKIFTDDAFSYLYACSENGVPRLINKICKLCLKAGETNGLDLIVGDVVRGVSERFQRLTRPAVPKRKPRTRPPLEPVAGDLDEPGSTQEGFSTNTEAQCVTLTTATEEPAAEVDQSVGERIFTERECPEEASIGSFKIKLDIPPHVLRQARSTSEEYCGKLAGVLAAQTLKNHPELTSLSSLDPVSIWSEIRDLILRRIELARSEVKS